MMANVQMLAFSFVGAETALALVLVIFLFVSKGIPDFAKLRKALREMGKAFDQTGFDAGQNLGGIHGKKAFEAITADNQNIELYDPAVSSKVGQSGSEIKNMNWKNYGYVAFPMTIGLFLLSDVVHIVDQIQAGKGLSVDRDIVLSIIAIILLVFSWRGLREAN